MGVVAAGASVWHRVAADGKTDLAWIQSRRQDCSPDDRIMF